MLLAIDIGNTSTTMGLFDDSLIGVKRIPSNVSDYQTSLGRELDGYNITDCIIASVVNGLDEVMHNAVLELFSIEPKHVKTEKMGVDRYLDVLAGKELYPLPLIIVDFGTANTFDVVNINGEYLGGLIAPGVGTQLKSLNMMTSKLPLLEIEESHAVIGDNTKDAMLSGIIRGTAMMVSGMIEETEKELGQKATVVATGGLSNLVSKYMQRKFDDINPSLTLEGLKLAYELNQSVLR